MVGRQRHGMPRVFHIEIVLGFSLSSVATAPVPPSSSIRHSFVMTTNSHTVNVGSSNNSRPVYFPAFRTCELMFPPARGALAVMAKKNLPPASTKSEVCKRLVYLRMARGMKAKEMAGSVGLTPTQWANYESHERMPNVQDMIRLANATGVTLDWIYRGLAASLPHHLALKISEVADDASNREEMSDEGDYDSGARGQRVRTTAS